MISVDDLAHEGEGDSKRTAASAIFWIVLMNLVFSFDSILSAIALTEVFWVMAAAIVSSSASAIACLSQMPRGICSPLTRTIWARRGSIERRSSRSWRCT